MSFDIMPDRMTTPRPRREADRVALSRRGVRELQVILAMMALIATGAGLVTHTLWRVSGLPVAAGEQVAWGFAIMSAVYLAAVCLWGWWRGA